MPCYRLIPSSQHENTTVATLARDLHQYRSIIKRVSYRKGDIYIDRNYLALETHLQQGEGAFYLLSTRSDDIKLVQKNFPKVTVQEEQEPEIDLTHSLVSELDLKYHFFLSLDTDRRTIEPLRSILEVQNYLQEQDKAVVQIILVPEALDWHISCTQAYEQFKSGRMPRAWKLSFEEIVKKLATIGASIGLGIGNLAQDILLADPADRRYQSVEDEDIANILRERPLSPETTQKPKYNAYSVTIRVIAISESQERREQILRALEVAFATLDGDNQLVPARQLLTRKKIQQIQRRDPSIKLHKTILSTSEVAKFLFLPTIHYQHEYKLTRVDMREVQIPEVLQTGDIPIGTATDRGTSYLCYWTKDYDYITLPKVIVGNMGAGKSTYTVRYAIEAYNAGHGVIVLDYIKECELAEAIKRHVKPKDLVELEIGRGDYSLSFPEIPRAEDIETLLEQASTYSEQVIYLINSLNDETINPLSARMIRTLDSACQIAFLAGYSRIMDVFDILTDAVKRHKAIGVVLSEGILPEDYHRIQDLYSLDEYSKAGEVVGTKDSRIEGITDRMNILLRNIHLERMLAREPDNEPNFIKLMDEGKVVLIKMRQSRFTTEWVKDTLSTYYLSRIWLATLMRGYQRKPRICHVITDEIHQLDTAVKVIFAHITESRKFGVCYFFTCQYLTQLRRLLQGVQGAGANYMLLAGTEKQNFELLREERGEFTLEELMLMKKYHSFNVVLTPDGTKTFISQLPRPA